MPDGEGGANTPIPCQKGCVAVGGTGLSLSISLLT